MSKLKPKNSVHLPDDSKLSMIYDKEKNRWIDVNNPDAEPEVPPPPPAFPNINSMPHNTPVAKAFRARYVNPLANEVLPATSDPVNNVNLMLSQMMPAGAHQHKD
ncbi:Protein transport protein Sec16A [Cichlidogyrus casuarinus]|uniref:Protein transport protein Sec16A n=1 Tax=Cichlidogyrus casuarinus TaxID=1844966 RepID=A0ABD2Q186_9PLAT